MRKRILLMLAAAVLLTFGYWAGARKPAVVHAGTMTHGNVPKNYGRLIAAIPDQIGTGLVFEDEAGVIRFVSVNGMKEGELARYDQTPTHGGIPKAYGHLVTAVVNNGTTGLIFEDSSGTIRFLTITGSVESELTRN